MSVMTRDQAWIDSTMAFYIHQLEKLDPQLHMPLFDTTWSRDIKLRTDVSFMHEATSFVSMNVGGVGTGAVQGKPWISSKGGALPGVILDGAKTVTPLRLLGRELVFNDIEMERFQVMGGNLSAEQFNALNVLYQLNTDECVYIGDTEKSFTGLVNKSTVTAAAVTADGTGSATTWASKTADLIVRDISAMEAAYWAATGYAVAGRKLLLPPAQFAYINGLEKSAGANKSVLQYVKENSLCLSVNGTPLDIQPSKWLTGRGANATDRMVLYTNEERFVRFPMVPVTRKTPYTLGINFHAPYIWAYGEVEFVETATVLYRDGI